MRKDNVDVQHIHVYMDKFVNFFCEILLLMYKVSYTDHVLSSYRAGNHEHVFVIVFSM